MSRDDPGARFRPARWHAALEAPELAATHEPFRRGVELACAAALARGRPGERWLDLGSGTGAAASRLAAAGLRVVAGDLDPAMLAFARRIGSTRFAIALDAERLPIADGAFDGVVAVSLLGHFAAPAKLLAEVARVLRPGGACLLTATNATSWSVLAGGLLGRLGPRRRPEEGGPSRYALHRPSRLAAACRAAGLEPLETTFYARLGPRRPWSEKARERARSRERTVPPEAVSFTARNFLLEAKRPEAAAFSAPPSAAPDPAPCS